MCSRSALVEPGYCQCGCGQKTNIAPHTNARLGYVKGQPYDYCHGHNPPADRDKFAEVDRGFGSACWEWFGTVSPGGYGTLQVNGRRKQAHRFMYEREIGPIPDGLHLDHLCRNTLCVNPAHLEPVTPQENTRRSRTAKLTREQVAQIKELCAGGWRQLDIAEAFGVHRVTVRSIEAGRTWADVEAVHA